MENKVIKVDKEECILMKVTNLSFSELPMIYKKALLEYCYMMTEELEELEEYYDKENVRFTIEEITPEEAKRRCMEFPKDAGDFQTFEEYHQWYLEGGDIPNHGESMYPVIQGGDNEWLDDGWHRFHSYILYGKERIPVLSFEL